MKERQANEIGFVVTVSLTSRLRSGRSIRPGDAFEDSLNVCQRLRLRGQRQIPSRVVGDACRVVESVSLGPSRRLLSVVAQDPELLEVCYMPNLPAEGIDDGETRPDHLLVSQVLDKLQSPRASFLQRCVKLGSEFLNGLRDHGEGHVITKRPAIQMVGQWFQAARTVVSSKK